MDIDIRTLRYFLTVAEELNFTRAAKKLNITQPTLSRQLATLEEHLGTKLFIRGSRHITLTQTGMLLKRRASEILDLQEKMLDEIKMKEDIVEGTITIGCGECAAVETLAEICKIYHTKYPKVKISIHTATADSVYEMMKQGLVDIGLFIEPFYIEGLEYKKMDCYDYWSVKVKPDDPLAQKEFITKEDLIDKPLIFPTRLNAQNEIMNWFGEDYDQLNISFMSNLGTNAGIMAMHDLGYPISIDGSATHYWKEDLLIHKKLYPEIKSNTILAWQKNVPYSQAMKKFIEEIKQYHS